MIDSREISRRARLRAAEIRAERKRRKAAGIIGLAASFAFTAATVACFVIVPAVGNASYMIIPDKQPPLARSPAPQRDEAAKPYSGAERESQTADGIATPGYASLAVPAGGISLKQPLFNPAGNAYYFLFEIALSDTGETLYTSGLVEPGYCIEGAPLSVKPAPGEYGAVLKISFYHPGQSSASGGVEIEIRLTVEKGYG